MDRLHSNITVPKNYQSGTVELSVIPGDAMEWMHLSQAGMLLFRWLKVYDPVDLNFDVAVDDVGIVGTGRLGNVY